VSAEVSIAIACAVRHPGNGNSAFAPLSVRPSLWRARRHARLQTARGGPPVQGRFDRNQTGRRLAMTGQGDLVAGLGATASVLQTNRGLFLDRIDLKR